MIAILGNASSSYNAISHCCSKKEATLGRLPKKMQSKNHTNMLNYITETTTVQYSFGPQEVLHEHAPMVIVTIKAWNGWLHKSFSLYMSN